MKYTEAWSEMATQNLTLKIVTIILGMLSIFLTIVTLKMSFKEAIVIERGCFSKIVNIKKETPTKSEIESFIILALAQRFDSTQNAVDLVISADELKLREAEQKELSGRNLKQRVLLNSITETSEGLKVEADRIISVGDIRSAFKLGLLVQIESSKRSLSNPYGLVLVSTKLLEDKSKKESK